MNYTNTDCRIRANASTFARLFRRKPVRKGLRVAKPASALRAVTKAAALLALTSAASAQLVIRPLTEATSKETKIYNHVSAMNFGSNLALTSGSASPDDAHFLSLIQFDLTGITDSSIVTSATLTLYNFGLGVSGTVPAIGGDVSVSPILDAWRETMAPGPEPLATYDEFFGATPTLHFGSAVDTETVGAVGFYSWDITNTVKSWVDGSLPNNGLLVRLTTPGGDIGFSDVDSNPEVLNSQPGLTIVPEPGSVFLCIAGAGALVARRRRQSASIQA